MSRLKGTIKPNRLTAAIQEKSNAKYDFVFSDNVEKWMMSGLRRGRQESYAERKASGRIKRTLSSMRMHEVGNKDYKERMSAV